ncbi:MAG: ketoacyl-ACP synthase III [Tannerella sp.]|jgi:3-oxoacyl-[acyl-carrier-protein] synthase-3|nr:ketoacyl-ACP synthase III [Tannerella sp.]
MAFLNIQNVQIKGISACVPKNVVFNRDYAGFTEDETEKFITATGIEQKRETDNSICTSDLCYYAAEQLINDLRWDKSKIDCLIYVTQTPDYILPATSCLLQQRLDLSTDCYALDISSGCSGWVYGLSVITSLMSSSLMKKGLLLCGDTISKVCPSSDKSTYPLFGDAGTVTAIEYKQGSVFKFHTATDGSGYEAIIIRDGGYRNIATQQSFYVKNYEPGISRNNLQLTLDGMDVFSFGISKAPQSVNCLLEHFSIDKERVDYYVFHQANMFMNEMIRKKLKLPIEKTPYSLKDFGNTSSATIPLTMITQKGEELSKSKKEIVACGFGVGLSWASVHFIADHVFCSKLIEI